MNLREIDRFVAEKVFGWTVLEGAAIVEREREGRKGSERDPSDSSRWHNRRIWIDADNKQMACEECGSLPAYSTDPAAAKLVREHLSCKGWNYELGRYGSIPAIFSLVITQPGRRFEATADDGEELATCLCALKAFGIEVIALKLTSEGVQRHG